MASIAETAAARIASILTVAGIAAGRVYRDRTEAFAQEESPAVVVEIDAEDRRHYGGSQSGAMFSLDAKDIAFILTYCTRSDNWQTVLDELRVQAHALLLGDDALNDLLQGFSFKSANWQAATADTPFASITQRYSGKTVLAANQL